MDLAHRQLAVIGDLPRRDFPGAAAGHAHGLLDDLVLGVPHVELEEGAERVADKGAEHGSETCLLLAREVRPVFLKFVEFGVYCLDHRSRICFLCTWLKSLFDLIFVARSTAYILLSFEYI